MLFEGKKLSMQLVDDRIAHLVFDDPAQPFNAVGMESVGELTASLELLCNRDDVRGLIISSAKPTFIVRADIGEFEAIFAGGPRVITQHIDEIRESLENNKKNFEVLEQLDFPVVAAINGAAFGGGLEMTLACDFRVLSDDAKIGLPESTMGQIPGWGGTTRLPRIIAIDDAINWICTGKIRWASEALEVGLADAAVAREKLQQTAVDVINDCHAGKRDFQQRRDRKLKPTTLSSEQLGTIKEKAEAEFTTGDGKHYPVMQVAIDTITHAVTLPFAQASALETEQLLKLVQTDICTILAANFFGDQLLERKARKAAKQAAKPNTKLAVLGAGIMGGGITYTAALKGMPVIMKDIEQQGLDLGVGEAIKLLNKRVKQGRMAEEAKAEVLDRIEPTLANDSLGQADFVVEAVVENPDIKCRVLADVESRVPEDAILASNTSTISISHLASALKRPENFCGMHFFNPVHRMPLVEIIRGEKTSDEAVARTAALSNKMGKKAVIINDCPGFLVNRTLFPYFRGFTRLLADGVQFTRLDKVMEDWGWPMGPAYLADVIGLDTMVHCKNVMAEGFVDRMIKADDQAIDLLLNAGRHGQKNGSGFYGYDKDEKGRIQKVIDPETDSLLEPAIKQQIEISDEDIVLRMMIPMATEMARCIEEGIVDSAAEADVALLYGLGFPRFRGGVLHWLDSLGAAEFCRQAERFANLGKLYVPTDGIQKMAAEGGTYFPYS